MRKIELTTPEGLPARIQSIKISLEKIYGAKLSVEFRVLPVRSLCSTENFLEKDKLALIFMKIVDEGYRVPIITVRKGGEYYVLDGHHRSYILAKMMEETVESYVLRFPEEVSYRAPPRRPIEEIPVIDVAPIRDPILRAWSQIIILLKYYEKIYDTPFYFKIKRLSLDELVPTQPQVERRQILSIKRLLVPIVCIEHEGRYYILDGHARTLRAREMEMNSIRAIILTPKSGVEYGIVKTVKNLGLESIDNLKIIG